MDFGPQKSFTLPSLDDNVSIASSQITFTSAKDFLEKLKNKSSAAKSRIKKDKTASGNEKIVNDKEKRAEEKEKNTVLLKQIFTIRQSLAIPNNFQSLPDDTWAIFSGKHIQDCKFISLVSALTTLILTVKYNLSAWHSSLLDYAIDSVDHFTGQFKNYDEAFRKIIIKRFPGIAIGNESFQCNILSITEPKVSKTLKQVLHECFHLSENLLMICRNYSCLVVKRYNFFYLYSGYPTSNLGYRRFTEGPASILRFSELDGLIRRVEFGCNQDGSRATNYIVVSIKVACVVDDLVKKAKGASIEETLKEDQKGRLQQTGILSKSASKHEEYSTVEVRERLNKLYNQAKKNFSATPTAKKHFI